MPNLLLISHGDYAAATLASCQMIVSPLPDVKAIAFKQTMNQNDFLSEIERVATSFSSLPTIIVDFKGGTPANTALRFQANHPSVAIYTGLSFSLLLSVATGTAPEQAYRDVAASSGLLTTNTAAKTTVAPQPTKIAPKGGSFNVRIDERLIHGQVATMWTNRLQLTRLMVVDNQVVKSSIQKTALKTACPANVHLSILTSKGAAKRIKSHQYDGQRVLLLVKGPAILKELADLQVTLPAINVGNMSTKPGSKQVAKSVAVTPHDIADFEALAQHGLKLYHQMVPAESAVDFMPLLKA